MEFVGKKVTKEFKGFGVFEGVVESYDSLSGFFKIMYEDGDSEEADLSEVTRLISSSSSAAAVHSIAGDQKVGTKRVGRKPKKRRRNDPGKSSSDNLGTDNSEQNLVIEPELGQNAVNDFNASVNVNGNLDGIDGNDGLDLNRGLNIDDGVQNGEIRGVIDLNLSVDDDGLNENDIRVERAGFVERVERGFDLNLGIEDESVNGENGDIKISACVGLGEEVKDGDVRVVDANLVNSRDCDGQLDGGGVEAVTPNQCQDGDSARRKRRKIKKNLSTPTETVLRRSARRSKAAAVNENDASSAVVEDEVNDLSVVSGVIDEPEEKPAPQVLERIIESETPPPKIELPPSSANLNLEGIPVLDIFSVYACLRSFSTKLYLSPFELEDLVAALKSRVSNQLIDLIHVAILQTLRNHLELLANEGCESALICLRNLNWDLLDAITWPVFMVEYLLIHGSALKPGFSLSHLKLFEGEYYQNPAEVKIELLRCLCDDVIEVEAIRSELSKRTGVAEANMDTGRAVCNEKKRRTSLEVPLDSCLTEDMKEEVADGNSDECCLCKMDGNLICCDGCPAAYHSKCVGIVGSLLPEGNWYCPECVIGKLKFANKPQKYIRGAELLGTDTCGRHFFGCFDYLLVSDSSDSGALCSYYHKDDLSGVIQLLQSSTILYSSILSAISQHWVFPTDYCQPKSENDGRKSNKFINSRYSGHSGSEVSEPADLLASNTAKPCRETKYLLTSPEGSGEVLQENELSQKSCRPVSNMVARGTSGKKISASKQKKKKGLSAKKGRSVLKDKEEDVLQEQPGDGYLNRYSFARTASLIVEELLRKPTGKVNIDAPKTEEAIISIQSKFILKNSAKTCWTTIQDINRKRQIEKCGWCYCCRFPVEGRGCLFSIPNGSSVSDALKVEIDDIMSKRNKKGHLVDVICYILYMEERLRGFLSGPWLRPQYSELWRQRVLKASDVSSLKFPLLTLEANLRPLAISGDWWKHVDLVTTMGSASHFVASSRATSKNSIKPISRKKVKIADSENKSSTAGRGLVFYWWRGGKTSRSLFNWKVIPRSLASKVARKAGCMKLPDIQYPDASEYAKRTKCVAWRAAVETSTSLEQLALQVREFDMFIRWDDIENTHPHSLLDKDSIKSIRLFKKVIIRRKCLEGTVARYLLDFGKRRSIPDVVLKHGQKFEKSDCERKKYWLGEEHVPLYLLKSFEERRITRKAGKKISGKHRRVVKVLKKTLREKSFDYLFSRAERADSYQCGHCNKNVLISEAVSCQLCKGYFHKRHVMKSSEGITSGCSYTCHKCRAGKHVKKESNLGKRKIGKLRDTKNVKAVSEGYSAALRPRKRGRPLGTSRKVRRNTKKVLYHEQSVSQKNTNISTGITLRRSARKAKCTTLYSNGPARKAISTTLHANSSAGVKKRKRNKRRVVASKKTTKGFSWQKKRTQILHSFWINGLQLSGKPNDERVIQFKRRKLLVPSEFSAGIDDQPKCSLCSQQMSTSALMYISCELCGDWFHGDAFGLKKGNVDSLIGFKCHVCRDRSPPACPFVGISRDDSMLFIEATCDAQESSEVDAVRKYTDCALTVQCNENSSGLLEAHSAQNCDRNSEQVDSLMLGSELRVINGSPTSKEAAFCSRDNGDFFIKASTEGQDAQELPEAVIRKETDCVSELQQKCDGVRDQYDTPMLDSDFRVDNSSLSNEIASSLGDVGTLFIKSSSEAQDGDVVVQCDTPMLDSDFRVENRLLSNDIASSLGDVSTLSVKSASEAQVGDVSTLSVKSSSEAQVGDLAVQKETDCVLEFQCNGGSSGVLEFQAAQNGNLVQDETPKIDSELRVVNGSPTSKEVVSCSKANESLYIKTVSEAQDPQGLPEVMAVQKETDVIEIQCIEGSSGILEVDSSHNCDRNLDQNDTLMLDSELRVENGSPISKEVASYSGEVKPFVNESSSGSLEAPGISGVVVQKETDCVQQLQCTESPSGLLDVHSAQSCEGDLHQGETLIVDPEVRVVNGLLTSMEVLSCSTESQDLDLQSKLLRESDENSILKGKQ